MAPVFTAHDVFSPPSGQCGVMLVKTKPAKDPSWCCSPWTVLEPTIWTGIPDQSHEPKAPSRQWVGRHRVLCPAFQAAPFLTTTVL